MADSKCRWVWLVAMLTALVATPVVGSEGAHEPPDLARGARLYSENCGRCHNARGPAEFSDVHWPIIVTHMRVISGLPGDQARAIEAFLRASNNPPRRQLARAKVEQAQLSGAELLERYGCRGCHRIGGSGGTIGPDLAGLFDRRQADWIHAQIQTPREHNTKTLMPQYGLSDAETAAMIEAIRSAQ
ncbi:MAG: c-type cytochrome [Acidimicrobiales bacterium]